MTLAGGSRLGPYEIVAPIGAGGMGEVYKARDTRLERTVAVKVLPPHLSSSPEARQRFEREAKTISQLSHSHICALYDVGSEGETEYLVMEYLEGETLTERLAKGALPLEQTLRYGIEIADALDKAHRQGIVHRDLKPGNVMLTKSGVKLLDFGLAKAMAPAVPQSSLTALPTMAGAQNLTEAGTILGTFQYMAPEQLEGKEADGRTDIFAFGAVLYEMATGRKAFSGTSQASLISAIMKEDPSPISTVQPMTPPALDRVVKTCLAKDPEERWQSAHDIGGELKWIAEGSQAGVPTRVATRRKSRERLAWAVAGIGLALAALLAIGYVRRAPRSAPLIRTGFVLPEKMFIGDVAVSPDGRRVAFTMTKPGGRPTLWVRDLDADAARAISGADGARFPFWSPDGRLVAFFGDTELQSVNPADGSLLTICKAAQGVGGTWARDGTIVFAPTGTSALFRVAASGGEPVAVTKLDASRHEVAHRYPWFLPDGRRFLYLATDLGGTPGAANNAIRVGSLDGKIDKALVPAISNAQFGAGNLLYVRNGNLVAQRFDLDRLETRGDPVLLVPVLDRASGWTGFFTFAATDSLLIASPLFTPPSRLAWFDRTGKSLGFIGEPAFFLGPRLSPDGRQIAVEVPNFAKDTADIWVYDAASGVGSKFIFGPSLNSDPAWSPDGSRIFFATDRKVRITHQDVWIRSLDGSSEQPYLESSDQLVPLDWTRDGRFLALSKIPLRERNVQIWAIEAADPKHQIPVATDPADHSEAHFSPDGKWIAYHSDESGVAEVYVRPFPGPGGKWKVSTGGGLAPRWPGDGREIFYLSPDNKIMAVPVTLSPSFQAGVSVALFTKVNNGWDVSRDGQRFLINSLPEDTGSPPLTLLINWTALVKKR
jgi:Tol biopolymer transport system component